MKSRKRINSILEIIFDTIIPILIAVFGCVLELLSILSNEYKIKHIYEIFYHKETYISLIISIILTYVLMIYIRKKD